MISVTNLKSPEEEIHDETFTPTSDVSGQIRTIFANVRSTDSPVLFAELGLVSRILKDAKDCRLILGVSSETKVWDVFLGHYPTQEAKIRAMLADEGVKDLSVYARADDERGTWARDLGIWADNGKTFVMSGVSTKRGFYEYGNPRPNADTLEKLKTALGVEKIIICNFPLEGGDYIPIDDSSFLGFHCEETATGTARRIEAQTKRGVAVLGNSEVSSPFPHLDSGVTFITNTHALTNDPRAIFELLSGLKKSDWDAWRDRIVEWYHQKMAGRPTGGLTRSETQIQVDALADLKNINEPGTYGYKMIRRSLQRGIEQAVVIAEQLQENGKTPVAIPGIDLGFPLTTVNSLVNIVDGNRKLYLMEFGCEKIDKEIRSRIEKSGQIDEIVITGLGWPLFAARGGNRCVVNALRY